MITLDPKGLEAAAVALNKSEGVWVEVQPWEREWARIAIETYLREVRNRRSWTEAELIPILAAMYRMDYAAIGRLCDEYLDRSGGLLGKVRDQARQINK